MFVSVDLFKLGAFLSGEYSLWFESDDFILLFGSRGCLFVCFLYPPPFVSCNFVDQFSSDTCCYCC